MVPPLIPLSFSLILPRVLFRGSVLIGAESRIASIDKVFASLDFVEVAVLHLRSNMISARWNLAVGPVIMVVGAYGAVLAATVATEFSGNKQEKVSETKTKA